MTDTQIRLIKIPCDCGATVTTSAGRVGYDLAFHMINAGCISVGEARQEAADLAKLGIDIDTQHLLAGWAFERQDQGDHFRAGDPVRIPCGCVISYDRTQVGEACDNGPQHCLQAAYVYPEA